MAIGLLVGLSFTAAASATVECVANRIEKNNESDRLKKMARIFQEASAGFGLVLVAAGLSRGDHGVAAGFVCLPALTFVASPILYQMSRAQEWDKVKGVMKKVHLVERNVAKVTNMLISLIAARMVYSVSQEARMFSALVGAVGVANAMPWAFRQVEAL